MNQKTLKDNLARVHERMAAASAKAGRDPAAVKLVAVTKGVDLATVLDAIDLGELDLGENRVQELGDRAAAVGRTLAERSPGTPPLVRWHMIGHLQRNKVRPLLPLVHMIHSVDTLRLAETIDQSARKAGLVVPVLLEVNCSDEAQKFGVPVGAVGCLGEQVATLPHVELRGLMAMAPFTEDPETSRPVFARMRDIFEDIAAGHRVGTAFTELSMGMSQDFQVAIEEGATMVRVGAAIFGPRSA